MFLCKCLVLLNNGVLYFVLHFQIFSHSWFSHTGETYPFKIHLALIPHRTSARVINYSTGDIHPKPMEESQLFHVKSDVHSKIDTNHPPCHITVSWMSEEKCVWGGVAWEQDMCTCHQHLSFLMYGNSLGRQHKLRWNGVYYMTLDNVWTKEWSWSCSEYLQAGKYSMWIQFTLVWHTI